MMGFGVVSKSCLEIEIYRLRCFVSQAKSVSAFVFIRG